MKDIATGIKENQSAYLSTAGKKYHFDLLSIKIWMTQFKFCPITAKPIKNTHIVTTKNNDYIELMSLYNFKTGNNFTDYNKFCDHIALEHNRIIQNKIIKSLAYSKLKIIFLILLLTSPILYLELIPIFYSSMFVFILLLKLINTTFAYFNPESADPKEYHKDKKTGLIREESKALVWHLQETRDKNDLIILDPACMKRLNNMRLMIADVYLEFFPEAIPSNNKDNRFNIEISKKWLALYNNLKNYLLGKVVLTNYIPASQKAETFKKQEITENKLKSIQNTHITDENSASQQFRQI